MMPQQRKITLKAPYLEDQMRESVQCTGLHKPPFLTFGEKVAWEVALLIFLLKYL